MKEIRNAIIESTQLGYEDHGVITCFLALNYGGSGQGFGGYRLDGPVEDDMRYENFGIEFIKRILDTVGAETWEKLTGKHIRVESESHKIYKIGNILEDKWFSPDDLWLEKKEAK